MYAAISKGQLVGLEIYEKKLRKNVTRQYIPPGCVVQGSNIVAVVPKKPLKWCLRRKGANGAFRLLLLSGLHAEACVSQN